MAALAAAELGVPEEEARQKQAKRYTVVLAIITSPRKLPRDHAGCRQTVLTMRVLKKMLLTCADIKGNEKKTICSLISNQTHKDPKNRFEMRSEVKLQEGNSRATLILRALYMNDSGDFYCSNSKKDSPRVTVTVKSVPEGSPERRNREARTVVDHSSTEGGSEGIQYSTLQFMETGGVEIHMDKDTVTYEELCSCD
ncbi:NAD-dependent protein deacylase sirtuin-5, mitochondrial [Varanus komodoensis]|nr:NAD-dependent protein deacylase sirtuin-5, mitochondrial [Varanus komodoensis]